MNALPDAHKWARLLRVALVPSYACNLRCAHCFVESDPSARTMTEGAFCALLDELATLQPRAVEITGGEPFAWAGHRAALRKLRDFSCPVAISTNGTLLEKEQRDLLRGTDITLCFSLDGPERLHDELRGVGAFARLCQTARACAADSIPFDLSCTVTRSSLGELPETIETALALGARSIHVSPMQQLGGRSSELAADALDDEGCVDLLARLAALRTRVPAGFGVEPRHIRLRVEATKHPCSVYACWGEFCPSKKHWPSSLYIRPDGEVLPQSPHIHPRYSLGNALDRGLEPLISAYWGSAAHQRFQRLCRTIYQDLIYGSERPLFFWDELARQASQNPTEELPDYQTVSHPFDHTAEFDELRRQGLIDDSTFPMRVR